MDFLTFCDWAAFSLGLIGLPLSIIDVFFNRTKNRIESFIDALEDSFEEMGDKFTHNHYYEVIFSVAVPSFIFILYYILTLYTHDPDDTPEAIWLYMTCLLSLPALIGVFFYFISGTVKFMNDITNGKAFISLGLMLMLLGAIFDTLDKILSPLQPKIEPCKAISLVSDLILII